MHNQIIGSAGMDHDTHLVHDNSYGGESWVDMNAYSQHPTTMADYGSSYGYMPPISGLPSESLTRMPPPPPPPQPMAQPQATHAQLPMLMVPPHATWPSMLTNPHTYGSHSAPPVVMPPAAAALKATKPPAIQTNSQPRKTLTDDDRRRMCEYAESHPHAKQTDIGSIFGVERSTVSKVLRNKEKYLFPEDRSDSPIKRTKGKTGVDIEKALANYIRNAQKNGAVVTGDDLKEKARLFSTTMSTPDTFMKNNSSVWLEKFMQKNGIGGGKLMRRASETNIPDAIRGSPSLTSSQPSSAISPSSPAPHPSPSPLSANRSDEDKESIGNFVDFGSEGAYKHSNSQSTASLSSAFTDNGAVFSAGGAVSPSGPFTFSPDPNLGGFQTADHSRGMAPGGLGPNFQRPRSQTFPTLDLEYMNQPSTSSSTEPMTPRYHVSSTAPSSALEGPDNGMSASAIAIDPSMNSPAQQTHQLHHSTSNSSLAAGAGRSTATPATTGSGSSPSSPTQEDARKAADTLLSFLQSAGGFSVDPSEYMAVVQLTEKLRIHQQTQQLVAKAAAAAAAASVVGQGMGGLSRIPEGDSEMTNAPPTMIKIEPGMGA